MARKGPDGATRIVYFGSDKIAIEEYHKICAALGVSPEEGVIIRTPEQFEAVRAVSKTRPIRPRAPATPTSPDRSRALPYPTVVKRPSSLANEVTALPAKRIPSTINALQRRQLGEALGRLPPSGIDKMLEIVASELPGGRYADLDEIEIDFEALKEETLSKLYHVRLIAPPLRSTS